MNDPEKEIVQAVKLIATGATREIQQAAIERFFLPDAGFQHALCTVEPAFMSRDTILGIYQWYKDMSPKTTLEVDSFSYDRERQIIYLNVTQTFRIVISPFRPAATHLLVRISLYKSPADDLYYIQQQDDFFQPEDVFHLTFPPLAYPVILLKRFAGHVSWFQANVFHATGLDVVARWLADMRE